MLTLYPSFPMALDLLLYIFGLKIITFYNIRDWNHFKTFLLKTQTIHSLTQISIKRSVKNKNEIIQQGFHRDTLKAAVWRAASSLAKSKTLIRSVPGLSSVEPLLVLVRYLYPWLWRNSSCSNDGFPGRLHFDLCLKCRHRTVLLPEMSHWMPWVKYL